MRIVETVEYSEDKTTADTRLIPVVKTKFLGLVGK